ncbi:hypothetical protein [Janthinobacterium sp. SUN137]|uniref:hypothetical protein n=1 Tax=Janthinobacterium sp. SUN137 TaxID=3014789 RepID=UPI0027130075|nr:hypothetical protein [Janthinobacterium sp. SUN137]MDO8041305.1 hypothetical protein [Janthinobacterium sp. SUN137]
MTITMANKSADSTSQMANPQRKPKNIKMDQYKEFCLLRDYRKPGVEVPHHTEAEAFALAVQNKGGHTEPAQRKKNPSTKGIK